MSIVLKATQFKSFAWDLALIWTMWPIKGLCSNIKQHKIVQNIILIYSRVRSSNWCYCGESVIVISRELSSLTFVKSRFSSNMSQVDEKTKKIKFINFYMKFETV